MSKNLEDTLIGILRDYVATFPSVRAASDSLGATYETFKSWYDGVKSPTLKSLSPFLDAIIASGRVGFSKKALVFSSKTDGDKSPDNVIVPVFAVAGAGPAWLPASQEPLFTVQAPADFMRRCDYAIQVEGHSMEPLIPHGAVVGIKEDGAFQANELFLANIPYEGLVVKRVGVDLKSEEFIFKSQNPDKEAYPNFRLSIHEAEKIIMGRVVWIMTNY